MAVLAVVASTACQLTTAKIPAQAQMFADRLGLNRTDFGTYLKVTWSSPFITTDLPERFEGGERALSSSIYQVSELATLIEEETGEIRQSS